MIERQRLALAGVLMLGASACSDPTGPSSTVFCEAQPDTAVVEIEDDSLALAIRSNLSVSPRLELTCGMVQGITSLRAGSRGIVSLRGIENLTSLTSLWIRGNAITDISPLRDLTGLTSLNVAANRIRDIEPLRGLTQLTFLAISDNGAIEDIDPLSGLTTLTGTLWMGGNAIRDLEPLRGLTGISILRAWDNAITDLTPLSGLTGLTELHLPNNAFTSTEGLAGLSALTIVGLQSNPDLIDVQALIDNPGFGTGTGVNLSDTGVGCADVDTLAAKGVFVISDCP
jgi:Leucine-rich repeat (LRR) protein